MITARIAVSATFTRGIPNYRSRPSRKPVMEPCVIYHAMPHGQRTPTRRRVIPEAYVDTSSVHAAKRVALACHASQREWLDKSQGMDSYLKTMDGFSRALGRQTRKFAHAEGWVRHLHYGFGDEGDDPLARAARGDVVAPYEASRVRRDGQLIEVGLTTSPVRASDGTVTGISMIARDISETKRTTEALRAIIATAFSSSVRRSFNKP